MDIELETDKEIIEKTIRNLGEANLDNASHNPDGKRGVDSYMGVRFNNGVDALVAFFMSRRSSPVFSLNDLPQRPPRFIFFAMPFDEPDGAFSSEGTGRDYFPNYNLAAGNMKSFTTDELCQKIIGIFDVSEYLALRKSNTKPESQ